MGRYACTECDFEDHEFYAYCPECGERVESNIEPQNPDVTLSDRV